MAYQQCLLKSGDWVEKLTVCIVAILADNKDEKDVNYFGIIVPVDTGPTGDVILGADFIATTMRQYSFLHPVTYAL